MAMYLADLAMMATIQSGLQHLKDNPDELEYILSNYVDLCMINKMTGGYKYVRMLMDVVLEKSGQQIIVDEYYTQNTQSNFAIYVISSGGESNKFFSDYGQQEQQQIDPKVYLIADAVKIKGKNKLVFLKNTGILDAVSVGMKAHISIPTGNFEATVTDIFPDKKSSTLPNAEDNLKASFNRVIQTKLPDKMMVQQYDIKLKRFENGNDYFEILFWQPYNSPVLDDNGNLLYIIHHVENITKRKKVEQ
jgi:hypothetical protein